MHQSERDLLILDIARKRGFVSFQELEARIEASPATIRRDLARLDRAGSLQRVRGGARYADMPKAPALAAAAELLGVPFQQSIRRNAKQKAAIGRAAAALCRPGEGVMIDGGSTTLQMGPHLAGLNLQVLTNSLHIVSALLPQTGTRILVPAG